MQSMSLNDSTLTMFNQVLFKFIWNKSYNAPRAPERIKRTIVLNSIDNGGFGMLDIIELNRSLKIKAFARLLTTEHPLFAQIRESCLINSYFDVRLSIESSDLINEAVGYVRQDRLKIVDWPTNKLTQSAVINRVLKRTKLTNLLTHAGKQSIAYLTIRQGRPGLVCGDMAPGEAVRLTRYFKWPTLIPVIENMVTNLRNLQPIDDSCLYPVGNHNVVNISKLSSKTIRQVSKNDEAITNYKIGLTLTQGEVQSWTKRLKKLTSVKHRSVILRIAHGEIYSNQRLHKFGLIDSPRCNNCNEAIESTKHKVLQCPKAKVIWDKLVDLKERVGLDTSHTATLEDILGVNEQSKISFAIHAEILKRILSTGGKRYCPNRILSQAITTIEQCEPLNAGLKAIVVEMKDLLG